MGMGHFGKASKPCATLAVIVILLQLAQIAATGVLIRSEESRYNAT